MSSYSTSFLHMFLFPHSQHRLPHAGWGHFAVCTEGLLLYDLYTGQYNDFGHIWTKRMMQLRIDHAPRPKHVLVNLVDIDPRPRVTLHSKLYPFLHGSQASCPPFCSVSWTRLPCCAGIRTSVTGSCGSRFFASSSAPSGGERFGIFAT